jgi:hypothetical protein
MYFKILGWPSFLGLKQVWGLMGGLPKFVTKFVLSLKNKKKLLVLKFNDLQKHVGHQKSKHPCPYVVGELFVNTNNQHAKNEIFFVVMQGMKM